MGPEFRTDMTILKVGRQAIVLPFLCNKLYENQKNVDSKGASLAPSLYMPMKCEIGLYTFFYLYDKPEQFRHHLKYSFFFVKFLEDISHFRGATDTPVFDFW